MLERKDVRFKLDPDVHAALSIVADADSLDLGEWVERLVAHEVARRVSVYTVAAEKLRRAGISGNHRGATGNDPGEPSTVTLCRSRRP